MFYWDGRNLLNKPHNNIHYEVNSRLLLSRFVVVVVVIVVVLGT